MRKEPKFDKDLLFKEGEMEDDGDDNYGNILRERI